MPSHGESIGPYRILSDLGSGGMGTVYLGEVVRQAAGLDVGARVAVKVVHPHLLEKAGFFKRFLREAEIGRAVHHDNVVRCHDCDALRVEGEQTHFLVMEYVEGQTLRALLDELETVPEELCRHVGHEIAAGLEAIHAAGVVHRDLKPENVLITDDHVVKIMDLGVAQLQDAAIRLSQTGHFVGSIHYAAPEQFGAQSDRIDARADLHALGAILYELSSGRHPFHDDDPRAVLRRVLDETPRPLADLNPAALAVLRGAGARPAREGSRRPPRHGSARRADPHGGRERRLVEGAGARRCGNRPGGLSVACGSRATRPCTEGPRTST